MVINCMIGGRNKKVDPIINCACEVMAKLCTDRYYAIYTLHSKIEINMDNVL